ncbi:hypothetical protein [Symbioplanes lichenis]|uniref:hypothetical protein n=1 Tax=Symbioplanes lichenis TaxID=1629072 RepID=UPI00273967DC|nr:hypothetical protein [Actinoplanes lichenis]
MPSDTELAVQRAFQRGRLLNVRRLPDPRVSATFLRFLLLGGVRGAEGEMPALRLSGARVTGTLRLLYADVEAPVRLVQCRFDNVVQLYGSRIRQLSIRECELPGLSAANATFAAHLRLTGSRITGPVMLSGASISNQLILDGAHIGKPGGDPQVPMLDGIRMRVDGDVRANDGFRCDGLVRLTNAEIAGSLRLEGAQLSNPGGRALHATDLRVGAFARLSDGFSATGAVTLHHAQVVSWLSFAGAHLDGVLGLRHLQTRELALLPARTPTGAVDLRHARIGLLRDDPVTWPDETRLGGLTYDALSEAGDRLSWLRRTPEGYSPQAYGQLAATYRKSGRDADAREVLLAGERHQREQLPFTGRLWGRLQDLTVGYGYRPARAVAWLAVLVLLGTVVFGLEPPRAAEAAKAPPFVAVAYTADLILPVVDLGQQSNYHARGWTAWLAYLLILSGLLFATTIAAAAARMVRRP